jgi:type I restriction enzyme M protein
MADIFEFQVKTKNLIDDLKSICANYGLGNDGNEFKIITQVFLYKFLNDKFLYELKKIEPKLKKSQNFDQDISKYDQSKFEILLMQLDENTARFQPNQLISNLFAKQNNSNFSKLFDTTLIDIAKNNSGIFSVITNGGEKIVLFDNVSEFVTDNRDDFCIAIINKLVGFSFENIFDQKFDFYAVIFEYLIKDYNSNSGGKYAEYFTPHSVAKIMAKCIVNRKISNVTCYDPSAGSGTLLMNLAHEIGQNKCTIYSQDISQKSSHLLRLNLILNNLVHSIQNIVKGNTILNPFHKSSDDNLQKFDFVVSNPPFNLDFSDYRNDLDNKNNNKRFFAGIPKIPPKEKDSMGIYLLFIQHIIYSLKKNGKAAVVVPTGFVTAKGIERKIREKLINEKMLAGVINMPSNIFAKTGTNVTVLFIDRNNNEKVTLIDASKLGTQIKVGKNKKTLLSEDDEKVIINTFLKKDTIDDFSIVLSYDEFPKKNFSFSPGQYFEVKIEHLDLSEKEFNSKVSSFNKELKDIFEESEQLNKEINTQIKKIKFD